MFVICNCSNVVCSNCRTTTLIQSKRLLIVINWNSNRSQATVQANVTWSASLELPADFSIMRHLLLLAGMSAACAVQMEAGKHFFINKLKPAATLKDFEVALATVPMPEPILVAIGDLMQVVVDSINKNNIKEGTDCQFRIKTPSVIQVCQFRIKTPSVIQVLRTQEPCKLFMEAAGIKLAMDPWLSGSAVVDRARLQAAWDLVASKFLNFLMICIRNEFLKSSVFNFEFPNQMLI